MSDLGSRIRDLREDSSWSAHDLAKACNLRERYLLDIEEGAIRFVHPRTLDKIADALGVTHDDLIKQDDGEQNQSVEKELPESYRWFVRVVIHTILILGTLSLIAILSVIVGLGISTVSIFDKPASQLRLSEENSPQSSLELKIDSFQTLVPE